MLLYFRVKYFEFVEQVRVITRFYRNWRFALFDLTFRATYFWSNPYRIARKYHQKKGHKNIHCYGETPLTTLNKIADHIMIKPSDVILEMGCGRARSCFWLAYFKKCHVIGIEQIRRFTVPAECLRRWFRINHLTIACDDYHHIDLKGITVVYLYASDMNVSEIEKISKKLESLKKESKLVSISFPIESSLFEVTETFSVRFNWGKTTAYLQRKIR